MRAFLLALEVEPVELEHTYLNLPLHCTMLYWFRADRLAADVWEAVRPVLADTKPVMLTGEKSALFGPSKGPRIIPVMTLSPTADLRRLHRRLFRAVEPLDVKHTEPYLLDTFNFHVTRQGTHHFETGATHLATCMYLVEAHDPVHFARKHIFAKMELGAAD